MDPEEIPVWKPFLRRVALFRDLSEEDMDRVAGLLKPLSLPKGATVFRQGDPSDSFFIISSGQVRLVSERQGHQTVLAYFGRGQTLGELALLTGEPRPATALLDATTEFLVLSRRDFAALLGENPAILVQMSRTLSSRFLEESRGREEAQGLEPELLALVSALESEDRTLLAVHLAHALVEQSRRRVLLVDMHPGGGAIASSLGLDPRPVTQEMLRGHDLYDPVILEKFVQVHASGLGVLTIPPEALAGGLFRSIFLFMNLLRAHSDFALLCLGAELGDVDRAVLDETDQCLLAGSESRRGVFLRAGAELGRARACEPRSLLGVWLGGPPPESVRSWGRGWVRIPWGADLASGFRAGESAFRVMERSPRSRRGVESLARRVARLRVGLAMGTGAALGFSLIGLLKAFEREHIPVDLVAGTSMGSVIGGLYAMGLGPEALEDIAAGIDKAWVWKNLLLDLSVPKSGLFGGVTMMRFLRSHFGRREFHDLELPFACVATDIETGEAVVLKDGPVAEAIRASCGIPLMFQPFEHRGRFLVDGGLVEPNPIRVLGQMDADILIAVNLTLPPPARKDALRIERKGPLDLDPLKHMGVSQMLRSPGMGEVFFQMIHTMEYGITKESAPLAHVYIQPELGDFSWTELHRSREIIAAGERGAEAALGRIRPLLPIFKDHCRFKLRYSPWIW